VVIRLSAVGWVLGQFILALAAVMLIPLGYSIALGGVDQGVLVKALLVTLFSGALMMGFSRTRPERDLKLREAILLVVLIWIAVCLFGALPFYFSPYFPDFSAAMFESVSGFTTTGATVLDNVEVLSHPIQFWRCFSHWLGGMGIVLLGVAVLPILGQGNMHLYRAEFSGAKSQRLSPRVVETAKSLWKVYMALTVLLFIILRLAGMDTFDALCHTFSTLGTGGFSTRTDSIAGFHSPLIEYIIIVFMLLAGISFIQHFRLLVERRPRVVFEDYEVRYYLMITAAATAVITGLLILRNGEAWEPAFRDSLFQVASILSTTGFVTADYGAWLPLGQYILLILMFIGGCTGSTAGGLKVARIVLVGRVVNSEFHRIAEPEGVFSVQINGEATSESVIPGLLNLFYLAWLVIIVATLLLTFMGQDILTAMSAVVACMFNVGPGLGGVGPMENYGHLPDLAKWVLSVCMLAGRLEFYTLLVIFTLGFWRR
jgi:trk system potassium uptake protein